MNRHSHYLFQVVPLFLQCQENLKMTISRIHFSPGRYESLFRLQKSLLATEKILYNYVFKILRESQDQADFDNDDDAAAAAKQLAEATRTGSCNHGDVLRALEYLKQITRGNKNSTDNGNVLSSVHRRGGPCLRNPQDATIYSTTNKSQGAESQLLFRLIIIFQLLLVRIDDAHYVITGHRIEEESKKTSDIAATTNLPCRTTSMVLPSLGVCCLGAAGMIVGFLGKEKTRTLQTRWPLSLTSDCNARQLLGASVKVGSSVLGFVLIKGFLNVCWMTDKIIRSNMDLLGWNHQWELIHSIHMGSFANTGGEYRYSSSLSFGPKIEPSLSLSNNGLDSSSIDSIDIKSKTLIEYARKHGRTSYFWRSTGEIRFLMVKRFMDIYYASVGVGVHCTKDNSFFLPLVAGAAASFYTITGAPTPTVVNNASSRDLIQHAW